MIVDVTSFIETILSADALLVGTVNSEETLIEYYTGPSRKSKVPIKLDMPGITPSIGRLILLELELEELHPFIFPEENELEEG